ncbi:MAG: hypothetical protein P1V36_15565 [Planctomycetota bacterium]|nr:hypothetical protein [Planctomycetota bacterium]
MRFARTILLLALLLPLAVALPAYAADEDPAAPAPAPEEPKPKPEPEPDPQVPSYSIEFLMPGEDDAPDGWKLRDRGAPAGSPTEDALEAMSEACKCSLDEDKFYVETTVMKSGDAKIGVAMVDVDASVWAFRRQLDEAAAAGGWKIVELGAKGRLLVVGAGAKQAEAADAMTEHVLYRFGRLAMDRLGGRSGMSEAGRKAALDYSKAITQLAPDTGMAQAVVGVVHWLKSRPTAKRKEVDKAETALCEAAWKKALAAGAKFPPKDSVLVFCAGEYGQLLLLRKDATVLPEATRVLTLAVEHEQEGKNNFRRYGNRYNLACCHARAGRKDAAFDMLEKALQTGKSLPPQMFHPQYVNMKDKDPDMGPLRGDARFGKLMEEFKPAPRPDRRKKKKAEKPQDHP